MFYPFKAVIFRLTMIVIKETEVQLDLVICYENYCLSFIDFFGFNYSISEAKVKNDSGNNAANNKAQLYE